MKIKSRLWLFVLLWGLAFSVAGAKSSEKLKIQSRLNDWILDFELTNLSREKMSFFPPSLPWNTGGGARFFAYCGLSNPKPLKEFLTTDYNPNFIDLLPAKTIGGSIDVRARFPGAVECRKENPITIFWIYRAVLEDGQSIGEFNGMIYLEPRPYE